MKDKFKFVLVALLFLGSGGVSLVYEIVWSRQLQLFWGSTTLSVSAILTSFFFGMAIGSYALGRWGNKGNPIRIYAILEICIGLYVFLMPFNFNIVDGIYFKIAPLLTDHFFLSQLIKFLFSFFVLIIPCTLIGGTLPVLSRVVTNGHANKNGRVSTSIGMLYAVNTLGAVIGVFLGGFFLIERFGLSRIVFAGGIFNLILGSLAFSISLIFRFKKQLRESDNKFSSVKENIWLPLLVYGIAGFCALAYEILWTRILIQTITSSTYAFSTVLLVFLLGTAIGSLLMSFFTIKIKNVFIYFVSLQFALAFIMILYMVFLTDLSSMFNFFIAKYQNVSWVNGNISMIFFTGIILLPPTILMGALFPVMIKWISGISEIGRDVGRIYSANTIGAILGSLVTGFMMIPLMGVRASLITIVCINILVGVFVLYFYVKNQKQYVKRVGTVGFLLVVTIWFLIPKQIFNSRDIPDFKLLFYKDGTVANTAVYECVAPDRNFRMLKINGLSLSGGTDKHALIVQRREGHLPMLLHPDPKNVLVIGLATGVTLSAVAEHNTESIECVEMVPSQLEAVRFFSKANDNVDKNPKVKIIFDDGRNYLRITKNRYDVIIGDLFQVASAGTGNLYAVEHVEACKKHLESDGIMVQWFPLQQMREIDFKSAIKSFSKVFPYVQLWFCDTSPKKPVIALVASLRQIPLDLEYIQQRIKNSKAHTLKSTGYDNPFFVLSQCIMQTGSVRKYCAEAPLNTYDFPTIEFSAPRIRNKKNDFETIQSLMKVRSGLYLNARLDSDLEKMKHYTASHYKNLVAQFSGVMNNWLYAETVLKEAIKETPNNFDTRMILGRTEVIIASGLLEQGEEKEALIRLNFAESLGINDPYLYRLKKQVQH